MKGRLPPRQHDVRDARRPARLAEDAAEQLDGEEVRGRVVERVLIAQAVATVQVADVGQLDAQAARAVIVVVVRGRVGSHKGLDYRRGPMMRA